MSIVAIRQPSSYQKLTSQLPKRPSRANRGGLRLSHRSLGLTQLLHVVHLKGQILQPFGD